jgi:hypothetical protein
MVADRELLMNLGIFAAHPPSGEGSCQEESKSLLNGASCYWELIPKYGIFHPRPIMRLLTIG